MGCPRGADKTFDLREVVKWRERAYERMSATEVARLWGVTKQAVGLWHSKEGCPRNEDATYNLTEVIAWREVRAAKIPMDQVGADSPALERLRAAKAEQEELKLATIKGQLIPAEQVEEGLVARVLVIKKALMGMPARMAGALAGLDGRAIRALLADEIERVVRQFAGQTEYKKRRPRKARKKATKSTKKAGRKRK
jgi:phage terminase Nu1 subunit (DNA packaging protein)